MPDLLQLFVTTIQSKTAYGIAMLVVGQLSFLAAAWSFAKKDILELWLLKTLPRVFEVKFNDNHTEDLTAQYNERLPKNCFFSNLGVGPLKQL